MTENEKRKEISISITKKLFKKIKKTSESANFNSINDCIIFILEEVARSHLKQKIIKFKKTNKIFRYE